MRTVTLPSGLVAEIREPTTAEWALLLEGDDFDRILTRIVLTAMVKPRLVWDRPPELLGPDELHLTRLDMKDVWFAFFAVLREALSQVRDRKLGPVGGLGS